MNDEDRTDLGYDVIFVMCAFAALGLLIGIIGLACQ